MNLKRFPYKIAGPMRSKGLKTGVAIFWPNLLSSVVKIEFRGLIPKG